MRGFRFFYLYIFVGWHPDVGKPQRWCLLINDKKCDNDKWEWMEAILHFNGFLIELKSYPDFIPMY